MMNRSLLSVPSCINSSSKDKIYLSSFFMHQSLLSVVFQCNVHMMLYTLHAVVVGLAFLKFVVDSRSNLSCLTCSSKSYFIEATQEDSCHASASVLRTILVQPIHPVKTEMAWLMDESRFRSILIYRGMPTLALPFRVYFF